ncbi:MAG: TIGR00725 family protein [Candidatus Omnitrophica bacterium]|nr:TIGR00725 family protein [Candidatus Omnitrophota bacterium]
MNRILKRKLFIGVIGVSDADDRLAKIAEEVGREIAAQGAVLVCGGLGGVMEYAARGAKSSGGITVGIIPGDSINSANPYIDIPIATGIGEARNIVIVKSSDSLIAIGKGFGTLSEISIALKLNKPVVGIETWDISPQIISMNNPREAVKKAISFAK